MIYRRRDASTLKEASYWHPAEVMPPAELKSLQEQKLIEQMQYLMQNSTFYQQKFEKAGINFEDIRSLEDLQKKYSELLESSDVNKRELKRTVSNLEHLKLNYEQADTDRKAAQEELCSVKEEKDGLLEQVGCL